VSLLVLACPYISHNPTESTTKSLSNAHVCPVPVHNIGWVNLVLKDTKENQQKYLQSSKVVKMENFFHPNNRNIYLVMLKQFKSVVVLRHMWNILWIIGD
jgi:hypothetical protein